VVPEEIGCCEVRESMVHRSAGKGSSRSPAAISVLMGLFLILALLCPPLSALGFIYLDTGAQPDLVAHAEGVTEYYPGDAFAMTVVLTNKGRDTAVQIAPRLSPGAYDPSTAIGVTVWPQAGDAPVTIKSLPVMAGDIGSWGKARLTVSGTVFQNATPGFHTIPLVVKYRYVYAIPMVGDQFSTIDLLYRDKEQVLPVTFRVRGDVRPAIRNVSCENMVPGSQGYLTALVENTGYATGNSVTLRVVPADNTTFRMVYDSVFIGKFAPGDVVPLRVRIAVREHTAAGSYPAVLIGEYKDDAGMIRATREVPLGIEVLRGAVFEVVNQDVVITPGRDRAITVGFRNAGDTPAYDARARIIGSHVLVPSVDSVDLGTIGPGETVTARFVISADAAIPGKRYVIDSEIKYRDELGALMLSDPMSFGIGIREPEGLDAITSNPVALIVIAGAIVLIADAVWRLRRRKR